MRSGTHGLAVGIVDVHRRAVADGLAALGGRVRVEHGRQEDRTSRRVEVEDLGRIGRQPEPVLRRPTADLVGAALAGP